MTVGPILKGALIQFTSFSVKLQYPAPLPYQCTESQDCGAHFMQLGHLVRGVKDCSNY